MKTLKAKGLFVGAALVVAGFINFSSFAIDPDPFEELKEFSNCWGTANGSDSCNGGLTSVVYGCTPENGSSCYGKPRL